VHLRGLWTAWSAYCSEGPPEVSIASYRLQQVVCGREQARRHMTGKGRERPTGMVGAGKKFVGDREEGSTV
jgi:hypothetical protein